MRGGEVYNRRGRLDGGRMRKFKMRRNK